MKKNITLRIDVEILKKAKEKCKKDGYTVGKVINRLLDRWVKGEIETRGGKNV